MEGIIRKVRQGDENALAYIQTESWKTAFAGILDAETLAKCTDINRATQMYQWLLDKNIGNEYILSFDGKPQCIAYWDAARDAEFTGKGEITFDNYLRIENADKEPDEVARIIKAAFKL